MRSTRDYVETQFQATRREIVSAPAAALLTCALAASAGAQQAQQAQRSPSLADARALRSLGAIKVAPSGDLLVYELDGRIIVATIANPGMEIQSIAGSNPTWSPDGSLLAYHSYSDGVRQISTWNRGSRQESQITRFDGGISPAGSDLDFSFAPDGRRIAFTSRLMGDYRADGRPPADEAVTMLHGDVIPDAEMTLTGLLGRDVWDAYDPSETGDMGAFRVRTLERFPSRQANHLFVANVDGSMREIPSPRSTFGPAWSPDGSTIAVLVATNEAPFLHPSRTQLALIDVRTSRLRLIDTSTPYNQKLSWCPRSRKLAMAGADHAIGFLSLRIYDTRTAEWTEAPLPGGASIDFGYPLMWEDENSVLLSTRNQHVNRVWSVPIENPQNGFAVTPSSHSARTFARAPDGEVYYTASGPTFTGRLYKTRDRSMTPLLDANPQLAELLLGEQRRVSWTNSRGDQVDGVVILPTNYRQGHRYPLIVDGYPWSATDTLKLSASPQIMGRLQAARGYVVFFINMRGPHAGYRFSRERAYTEAGNGPGGIDLMVDDIESGILFLIDQGIVARERVGIYGHSNGGYVANFMITRSSLINAAVISAGVSNLLSGLYGFPPSSPDQINLARTNYRSVFEDMSAHIALSPVFDMERVRAPVLLLSGNRDTDWTIQTTGTFNTLRLLGKEVTWRRYRDEGHAFVNPTNVEDALHHTMEFFDQHLKPPLAAR